VKKLLVLSLILAFMTVMAYAGEKGKTCSETCKIKCAETKAASDKTTATEAKDPHAGCDAKATGEVVKAEEAPAAVINANEASIASGAPKIAETCPDTKGQAELEAFHGAMSPMHMALEDNKYDEMRKDYPNLAKTTDGIKAYNCPMGDKCPPECKKAFEGKKAELLKAVDEVGVACKGTDDKKLESAFMTMHEAYINFATMCKAEKPAEEKK